MMINVDHWHVRLPLNDEQTKDYLMCHEKLLCLLNVPIRVQCLTAESLLINPIEPTNSLTNHRHPLKMYWQRNIQELRLFLRTTYENSSKLNANLIEVHQRRNLMSRRYVKQDLTKSSVIVSFQRNSTNHRHSISIRVTGKQSILEFQIPSTENERIFRGTYRKIGEDTQSRSVTTLFNCTLYLDKEVALILNEYGLCRLISD